MKPGDILGHEFIGKLVETGSAVANVHPGDRVIVPFCIACGDCFFCKRQLYSCCDNSNPKAFGFAEAGILLPPDAISRRPSIPLRILAQDDRLRRFLDVMDWYFLEVKATA